MSKTGKKFRTALSFLLQQEGRTAQARLSKKQDIDSGYLNSIIKGRKPGSITVKEKIASHFDLEYEDMLYLGHWIQSGNQGEEWQPPYNSSNVPSLATPQPNHVQSLEYSYSSDKNMRLLAEWIDKQNEPSDFWILLKMTLARKYPAFDIWLKKQQGEGHLDRFMEEKTAIGG